MSKIVLLDVDGTLLNWRDVYVDWLTRFDLIESEDTASYSFQDFIKIPGDPEYKLKNKLFSDALVEIFNQTYLLSKLPPIPGAVEAIEKLNREGYILKAISSYTTQYEAMKSREYNLKIVFGNVFQEITSLPLFSSKKEYLSKQDKESIFVEDSLYHLRDAEDVGFDTNNLFLINADWNLADYEQYSSIIKFRGGPPIKRKNWKEITEMILG